MKFFEWGKRKFLFSRKDLISTLKHRLFKESALVFLANICSAAISMLTGAALTRCLSVEDFGIYSLFFAAMNLFTFMTLPGMDSVVNKAALKNNDAMIFPSMKKSLVASIIGSFCLLGCAGLCFLFKQPQYGTVLILVAFLLPALVFHKFHFVLVGKRKFRQSRLMAIIEAFSLLLVLVSIAWLTKSVILLIIGLVLLKYLIGFFGWLKASKLLLLDQPPLEKESLYRQGYEQSVLSVFNLSVGYLDRIVLGIIDLETLAYYHIATLIPNRVKEQIKSIVSVPVQTWSAFGKKHYLEKLQKNFQKLFLFLFLICLLLSFFTPLYIPFLFGKKYMASIPIALIHVWTLLFRISSAFLENINIVFGDSRYYQFTVYFKQSLYICLLPFALYYGAVTGLALLLLFSDFLNYLMQYFAYRKETQKAFVHEN